MTNTNRTVTRVWADPVLSSVISAGIVTAIAAGWATIKGKWGEIGAAAWSYLKAIKNFLGSTTPTWNWLLLMLVVIALLVGYVVLRLVIENVRGPQMVHDFRTYKRDAFEGLIWYWSWSFSDTIDNLYCCCPTCELQLIGKESYGGSPPGALLVFDCESCGKQKAALNGHDYQVEQRISRLIQQKLRTGAWVDVVEGRANN